MLQNVQGRAQPSEIFRYADGPTLERRFGDVPLGLNRSSVFGDFLPGFDAEGGVDSVNPDDLLTLDLRPATGHNHLLISGAVGAEDLRSLARFLTGVVDEPAGVEDHQIRIGAILDGAMPFFLERSGDSIRIGGVFRAAERDDLIAHQPPPDDVSVDESIGASVDASVDVSGAGSVSSFPVSGRD